jgi:hypothetical protein
MRTKNTLPWLLICAGALSGCATVSPAPVCPEPQEMPAELMQPVPEDFSERIKSFFFESDEKPTQPPSD